MLRLRQRLALALVLPSLLACGDLSPQTAAQPSNDASASSDASASTTTAAGDAGGSLSDASPSDAGVPPGSIDSGLSCQQLLDTDYASLDAAKATYGRCQAASDCALVFLPSICSGPCYDAFNTSDVDAAVTALAAACGPIWNPACAAPNPCPTGQQPVFLTCVDGGCVVNPDVGPAPGG